MNDRGAPTEAEIAWAAGLFEGEGTITTSGGRPRLALKMTDVEPVQRFAEIVGYGRLYGPYGNKAAERRDGHRRKRSFMWVATGEEGRRVAEMLLDGLSQRRRDQVAEQYT